VTVVGKLLARRRSKHAKPDTGMSTRDSILAAARRLFAENEFKAVTTKRLAEAAGVTTAMIHYYFGEKASLYEAVVAEIVDPTFDQAQALVKSGASFEDVLANAWRIQEKMLVEHSWLPAFMVRVMMSDNQAMQRRFARKFAKSRRVLLSTIIERDKKAGKLRPNLDPFLTTISIVSLFQYPLLAAALRTKLFGVVLTPGLLKQLAQHNHALILDGVRAKGPR
jgi:TetR/AcrR family transcriptional regulator